jgi:hypothetical protein
MEQLASRSTWILLFIAVLVIVGLIVFATTKTPTNGRAPTQTTNKSLYDGGDTSTSFSFLFVGNSYTSANSLQTIFANVMTKDDNEVYTESVAPGGWRLGQHWDDFQSGGSELSTLLAPASENNDNNDKHEWEWVILQDQSQVPGFYAYDSPGWDYDLSLQGAIGLNNVIRNAGGQTMFFMTWGRRFGDDSVMPEDLFSDFVKMQQKLTQGYRRYQNATSTMQRPTYIAPVGLVFQTIYNDLIQGDTTTLVHPTDDGTLFSDLYSSDGSHPSILGSYVAAVTIYSSITGLDPTTTVRDNHWPDSMVKETARLVHDAVKRTLLETAANGFISYPWGDVLRGDEP